MENAYLAKIEHAVQAVDKWLEKIGKLANSRKYDLGADRKNFILSHLGEKFDATAEAVRGKTAEVEKFKLS